MKLWLKELWREKKKKFHFIFFLSASSSISKHCFWSLMELIVGQGKEATWSIFFSLSLQLKGKGKKNHLSSVLTLCLLIAEHFCIQDLTFRLMVGKAWALVLHSESAFPVLWSGRKRHCRAGPVCAVSRSVFRCAPLPAFHVAAHVNLGIAFNFCVLC